MCSVDESEQRVRGRLRAVVALALATTCVGIGCDDELSGRAGRAAQHGTSSVGGSVVSTVNGHPIRVQDVEALVRASSLSPREALERLQAELLLMGEAERRGVADPAIDAVAERAKVQALLDREAARNTATEDEVRAAYATDARMHVPERRASIHVLARVAAKAAESEVEAARRVAEAALPHLASMTLEELKERYSSPIGSVEVKAEAVPATPRDGGLVAEYLGALYSMDAEGVVPAPVRTQFGWHAIRVTEILPEEETPYEKAAPLLRQELSVKKQTQAVQRLMQELRREHRVEVMDDADDKLAAIDGTDALSSR